MVNYQNTSESSTLGASVTPRTPISFLYTFNFALIQGFLGPVLQTRSSAYHSTGEPSFPATGLHQKELWPTTSGLHHSSSHYTQIAEEELSPASMCLHVAIMWRCPALCPSTKRQGKVWMLLFSSIPSLKLMGRFKCLTFSSLMKMSLSTPFLQYLTDILELSRGFTLSPLPY